MKLINTSSEFKYKYIIITILIVLFASVKTSYLFADRLLIGIDSQHNSYLKGRGGYFQTCKPDSEKVTKTGDFVRDECGEGGDTGKTYPNVSLEINFGEPSTGWGLMLIINATNKNRIKFVNFPNDNESAIIEHDIRFIGVPIIYTWGDPELGKNGGWAIRAGVGAMNFFYDPLIIETKDKTVTKRGSDDASNFLFFSWDWNKLSLIYQQLLPGRGIQIDEIKNNKGEPIKISTMWTSASINYSWYF